MPTTFLFVLPRRRTRPLVTRKRLLSVYLLSVILTQGVWCAKNAVVYKTFTLSTSSWTGLNFAIGLERAGRGRELVDVILDDPGRYPSWFVKMLREQGLVHWHPPIFENYLPDKVKRQEESIQHVLEGTNRSENSIGQRLVADQYQRGYLQLLLRRPQIIGQQFLTAYALFWQPIRNYSALITGCLLMRPVVTNSFDVLHLVEAAVAEDKDRNEYFIQGPFTHATFKAVSFYTLPCFPTLMHAVNIVTIHAVMAWLFWMVALCSNASRDDLLQGKDDVTMRYLFLVACYFYAATVMNVADYQENMRFRVSIEPEIWLISVAAVGGGVSRLYARTQMFWT